MGASVEETGWGPCPVVKQKAVSGEVGSWTINKKMCIVTLEQRNPEWTGLQKDLAATMVAGLVGEGLGYSTETKDR